MEKETKVWGERWLIRKDSGHALSVLKLEAGTRCSWHYHRCKFNHFVVLDGRIALKVASLHGEVYNIRIELGPGDEYVIPPGVAHEFQVLEDSTVIEEMYVSYDEEDILRMIPGGALEGFVDPVQPSGQADNLPVEPIFGRLRNRPQEPAK